jgi:hypothetical protein
LYEISGCKRDVLGRSIILHAGFQCHSLLQFRTLEASKGIVSIGGRNEPGFAEIIFGLKVLDFRLVRSVDHANWD